MGRHLACQTAHQHRGNDARVSNTEVDFSLPKAVVGYLNRYYNLGDAGNLLGQPINSFVSGPNMRLYANSFNWCVTRIYDSWLAKSLVIKVLILLLPLLYVQGAHGLQVAGGDLRSDFEVIAANKNDINLYFCGSSSKNEGNMAVAKTVSLYI